MKLNQKYLKGMLELRNSCTDLYLFYRILQIKEQMNAITLFSSQDEMILIVCFQRNIWIEHLYFKIARQISSQKICMWCNCSVK